MINYRKKTSYFDVYRDVLIPFVSIVSFFWICLWKSESLSWDSRMFLALLGAVFFNYFISYWNNRKMIKDQRFLEVKIYVLLWEIIVPMLTMVVVIFSMILENRFYDWNVFLNALNSIGIYIVVLVGVLFLFFFLRGLRLMDILRNNNLAGSVSE